MLTTPGHFPLRPRGLRQLLALAACWAVPFLSSQAQTYTFYTVAGVGGSGGYLDGSGGISSAPALFDHPSGVALDSSGNIYVTDASNSTIRKITPAGVVSTLAGTAGVPGSANGTGSAANFNSPQGPAVDSAGNIYVAEFKNSTIRKITSAGVVTTLAGAFGLTGAADGTGTAGTFNSPRAVAVDGSGNVYVADTLNNTIRKVTSAGVVTTLAGIAGTAGHVDGAGTVATFNYPSGVAVDGSGNVYVADTYNHLIRKITSAGVVSTLAGIAGTVGSADGAGTAAAFDFPAGVAGDSSGNIFVADQGNDTIRKITPAGVVSTVAGTPLAIGRADGTGGAARFNQPTGVTVDSTGNLYVADYENNLIRKVTAAGVVTTIAGAGGVAGSLDGAGWILSPSQFWRPTNLAVDGAGDIFVSDTFNDTIRKISPSGVVTTLAGTPDTYGSADGTGTAATFNGPSGVAVDSSLNVYVADTYNHTIRAITPAGLVTTLAGTAGTAGSADGAAASASFNFPSGVAVDNNTGSVYVADYNNHTIRRIAGGQVSTFAGAAGTAGSADGAGGSARFDHPRDLAVDGSGNLYVADTGNHVIRKISTAGVVTTLAGAAGVTGSADGSSSTARFNGPSSVSVDSGGNVYVADMNNSTIRMIAASGAVTTLGGMPGVPGSVDGAGATARFDHPTGIAVDSFGDVFIADNNNNTIREGVSPTNTGGPIGSGTAGSGGTGSGSGGTPVVTTGINGSGSFNHPGGLTMDASGNVYIADTQHHSIKKVSSGGVVTTLAGKDGTAGSADGAGTSATFNMPTGITIGSGNILFVTDTGNATIRKILADGTVSTLAGSTTARGNLDGTGTAATFSSPSGIAIMSTGDLLVADSANATIRKVSSTGVVTTVAGTAQQLGDKDGTGPDARFNNPTGLAVDTLDNLFIADTYNDTIREMTPAGVVTTLAGSAGISGSYDGSGSYALFNLPSGVTVVSTVAVYVTDTGNNTLRFVTLDGKANVQTLAGFTGIAGAKDGIGSSALFNQPQAAFYNSTAGGIYVSDTGNAMIRFVLRSTAAVSTPTFLTSSTSGSGGSTSGSSSGGGGAMEAWFAVALLALGGARCWSGPGARRRLR